MTDIHDLERACVPAPWYTNPDAVRVHRVLLDTTPRNLERPWKLMKNGELLGSSVTGDDLVEMQRIVGGEIVYADPVQP
jgi:hypothetical protein